jgi:hypothetical protein
MPSCRRSGTHLKEVLLTGEGSLYPVHRIEEAAGFAPSGFSVRAAAALGFMS